MLTFLIPVRHPDSVSDWSVVRALMAETLRSVAAQAHSDWACYLGAETCADLPPLPPGVHRAGTAIPKPDLPDLATDRAGNYEAVKRDKGARALAALEAARADGRALGDGGGHVMVVDYDDLVSNRLAGIAAAAPDAAGWHMDRGWLWSGGDWAVLYPGVFHKHCGTSQIVHARHMPGPDDPEAVARHLGSHMFVTEDLAAAGTPMVPLGFAGAVYRIGHGFGVSRSKPLWRRLINTDAVRRPALALGHVAGLRRVGAGWRQEFLGDNTARLA